MQKHTLLLDGDMLGVTSDSTVSEVWDAIKKVGITQQDVLLSHHVQICFGESEILHLKDRQYGRCDFK